MRRSPATAAALQGAMEARVMHWQMPFSTWPTMAKLGNEPTKGREAQGLTQPYPLSPVLGQRVSGPR